MDGVVHPNVEQAIGRDRIRKALKRYENRPADEHRYGIVRSVNEDGSYEVLLDGDVQTSRCAQYSTALVGDRVLAVTKKDGRNDLLGRLGGEIGGGGTVVTKVDDVSNYIAGRVFPYAGTDEPIGSLLCDGRAVSRREYWELFDAIGTTYGAGDGSSTFNLPNIESRTIIGESDSYALGSTGGEESHALTAEENGPHSHNVKVNVNAQTQSFAASVLSAAGYEWTNMWTGSGHETSANNKGTNFTEGSGYGTPHNNMQPYIVMRYFITTGKGDPVSGINPADYVVEWGETGIWRWEKYASGKAECWCELTTSCEATNAYGGLYYASKGPYTFPFEFKSIPNMQATVFMGNGLWDASVHTLTTTGFYIYAQSATSMKDTPTFMLKAKGFWKDSPASGGTETIAPTIAERFEGIEADIDLLKTNKVLWSGVSGMNANQTATLSEAVSTQPNGIVLAWSAYENGAAANYNWSYKFIPKQHVINHEAATVLSGELGLYQADHFAKKVAVRDTTITGVADNWAIYTADITWNNSSYVLRHVIGV